MSGEADYQACCGAREPRHADGCPIYIDDPASQSVSQRITALIKTDDWVIVHRGHGLIDAEDLDQLESEEHA